MPRSALAVCALLAAGPALADAHLMDMEGMILAGQIEDGTVYALGEIYEEEDWEGGAVYELDPEYETVGEIEDVVLSPDGHVVGILAEVGGFLGIGDRTVMLPLDDVRLVPPADGSEFAYVTRLSAEAIEELPLTEFDVD